MQEKLHLKQHPGIDPPNFTTKISDVGDGIVYLEDTYFLKVFLMFLRRPSQGLTEKYSSLMQLDHFYQMIQFLPLSFKEGVLTAAVRKVMSPQ